MKKPLHFLTLYDLPPSELNALVLRAIELKKRHKSGLEDLPLKGKVLAMISSSTRLVRVLLSKLESNNLEAMQFT